MATPTLQKCSLPGALGPILIDLRTGEPGRPRPAVVVLHGFKGFKDWGMFPPLAERLARAGFAVVSYNASGSGVDDAGEFSFPERFGRNTYSAELEDLGRVLEALRSGNLGASAPSAVSLVGHSRGGGIAVLHAARDPGIATLVTWAAIGSVDRWSDPAKEAWRRRGYVNIQNARTGQVMPLGTGILDDIAQGAGNGLNIRRAAAGVKAPWLILHGEADESVDVADARALAAANPAATLKLIPEAGHTFGAVHPFKGMTPELEQVFDATVKWTVSGER
ncbi:MAG: alpha/beta hydrolase family protein [Gemmatimonadales bacterium]